MSTYSKREGDASQVKHNPPKRKFHTKARTGCKTCKQVSPLKSLRGTKLNYSVLGLRNNRIRRIRCDEAKPCCRRCTSTGRTCDGYPTTLAGPLPQARGVPKPAVPTDKPLVNASRPLYESRGFQYFVEVTAPSLAGALDIHFWLEEIPMVCQQDPALWHAVVSLAYAHEIYVSGTPPSEETNVLALRQFNLSIQHLITSCSRKDWWRSLTASTIFTCICILEDKYDEAMMHYESGYNLLRNFDSTASSPKLDVQGSPKKGDKGFPVSLVSLRSILIGFEVRLDRTSHNRISQLRFLSSGENKYTSWRDYTSPVSSVAPEHLLTRETLRHAVSATESMYYEMALYRRRRTNRLRELYQEDKSSIERPWAHEVDTAAAAYHQFCTEMDQVIRELKSKLNAMSRNGAAASSTAEFHAAILSLELVHFANQLYLEEDFATSADTDACDQRGCSLDVTLCDLAEQIMSREKNCGCKRSGGAIASTTVLNVLVSVVQRGRSEVVRNRARRLLRQPRTEGLWDMLMAASFADAISARESTATDEYRSDERVKDLLIYGLSWMDVQETSLHPMARVCHSDFICGRGRTAKVTLSTWWEWLEGKPGQEITIKW